VTDPEKVVLCFSGGLDSTTLLYRLQADGHEVSCVGFDYGQSHVREMAAAKDLAAARNARFEIVTLDASVFGSTVLTGSESANLIIPNRNAIFLSLAAAIAIRDGARAVAIGCHSGDHEIWPDCRSAFLDAMAQVLFVCHTHRIQLLRPFVRMTKLDVVRQALNLGVPVEATWTCYKGADEPCGVCVACIGRREALFLAGTPCTA
jgi:7-cyano-7-deazaguanine synthase